MSLSAGYFVVGRIQLESTVDFQRDSPEATTSKNAVCVSAVEPDYSFAKYSPKPELVAGELRPRRNAMIYRGTSEDSELNAELFIASVLGDPGAFARGRGTNLLLSILLSEEPPDEESQQTEYLKRNGLFQPLVQGWNCLRNLASSRDRISQAAQLSAEFMNDILRAEEKRGSTIERYLDYKSLKNIDRCSPERPEEWAGCSEIDRFIRRGEVVYGTTDFFLARAYAKRFVFGYRDHGGRSVDLNYFNYAAYGEWLHNRNDRDEIIIPGFVRGADLSFMLVIDHEHTCLLKADIVVAGDDSSFRTTGSNETAARRAVIECACYPNPEFVKSQTMGFVIDGRTRYPYAVRRLFVACETKNNDCEKVRDAVRSSFAEAQSSEYSDAEAELVTSRVSENSGLNVSTFTW